MTPEEQYQKDLREFNERMEAKRPKREDFATQQQFEIEHNKWLMEWSCDAPNKPGYYRANND